MAPQVRKHLSADALFRLVHSDFTRLPDYRVGDTDISLADALMSAFAMFSLKAPSLLAFDKERAEGNLHTIYGIERVPCDTRMREILDPLSPKWLRPGFKSVLRQLQRGKALEEMVFLDGHYLLALDGTEKNDCERNAAKRFVAKLRQDHPHLKCIITEDSLSSNAPHIETLQHYDLHYILGVKEGDHAFLFQQVQAAEHAGRVTLYERHDRAAGLVHRFRFLNDVPLNASH